ncbi:hypothetical protein [Brevundimonas bullata]
MTDLIPLAIAAAIILAVVVFVRLCVRKSNDSTATGPGGSRGRPGADKH